METVIEFLFLFCLCATAGWVIEVVYRAMRHHKVVNPGFLKGPCLPIYGMGGSVLYFLSGLSLSGVPYEWLRVTVILVTAIIVMTLIELAGGLISLKVYHVRLWDYSGEWMNFKGVICPKFSFFWGVICAAYYFLLYPPLHDLAGRLFDLPWMLLLLGMYLGVFFVDLEHSLRLLARVRAYALEVRTRVSFDQLKAEAKEYFKTYLGRRHGSLDFHRMINRYMRDRWGDDKNETPRR